MDKRMILLFLVGLMISMMIVGCAPQKKEESKQSSTATIVANQVPTQEMKTYVSKYGFSLDYPEYWGFMKNPDRRESANEGESYCLYTDDAHRSSQEKYGIIIIIDIEDVSAEDMVGPLTSKEKFWEFAKKFDLNIGGQNNELKRLKLAFDGYLIYRQNEPRTAVFFLSEKLLVIGLESEYGIKEFLSLINSIKKNSSE
jgi:hypothetical protein